MMSRSNKQSCSPLEWVTRFAEPTPEEIEALSPNALRQELAARHINPEKGIQAVKAGVEAALKAADEMADTYYAMTCSPTARQETEHREGLEGANEEPWVNTLTEALCDVFLHVGTDASGALTEIDDPDTIMAISSSLTDINPDVGNQAVTMLSQIGGPKTIEALLPTLAHHSDCVKAKAINVLGWIEPERLVDVLVSGCTDAADTVWARVVEYFEHLGREKAVAVVVAALEKANSDRTMAALVTALLSHDPIVSLKALATLQASKKPGVDEVVMPLLEDEDHRARVIAVRVLGGRHNLLSIEVIVQAFGDKHPDVRREAMQALCSGHRTIVNEVAKQIAIQTERKARDTTIPYDVFVDAHQIAAALVQKVHLHKVQTGDSQEIIVFAQALADLDPHIGRMALEALWDGLTERERRLALRSRVRPQYNTMCL